MILSGLAVYVSPSERADSRRRGRSGEALPLSRSPTLPRALQESEERRSDSDTSAARASLPAAGYLASLPNRLPRRPRLGWSALKSCLCSNFVMEEEEEKRGTEIRGISPPTRSLFS